jgi:excisionase family DNA binding protein
MTMLKHPPQLDPDDEIWDPPGLAAFLKVDKSWVYRAVEVQGLPAFRLGKYLRFKRSAVLGWIAAQNAATK